MASPEMAAALAEMKVGVTALGHYELWKLNKEQYIKFRYIFVENRMHNQLWVDNKNDKAMQLLLNAFALVVCKKVPSEIGVKQIDSLHNKVKILAPQVTSEKVKPLGAVLRLTPAFRSATALSEDYLERQQRTVEIDQESKAVAVNCRPNSLPFTVQVLNQYACRMHREDFVNAMSKVVPDFFKDEVQVPAIKILTNADKLNTEHEEHFISSKCSVYELPCFEIPINAHTYD